MANITKRVQPGIGASQYWDSAVDLDDGAGGIGTGDVFRIEESLGKPATNLTIKAAAAMTIRINAYNKVYPNRQSNEFFNADMFQNIYAGVENHDTTQTPIAIAANNTFVMNGQVPIRNIEIVSAAGAFTVLVS